MGDIETNIFSNIFLNTFGKFMCILLSFLQCGEMTCQNAVRGERRLRRIDPHREEGNCPSGQICISYIFEKYIFLEFSWIFHLLIIYRNKFFMQISMGNS